MRSARRGGFLAAVVWIASACNGALTFDQTPGDASLSEAMSEAAPVDSEVDGVDGGVDAACADVTACGWRVVECGPAGDDACEVHCESGHACTNGTCGAACTAECKENSSCSIAAGDGAQVECGAGASCTFTLGVGGSAACEPGSSCRLRCLGRCSLTCQAGATCTIRCGDATTEAQTVTGKAACP